MALLRILFLVLAATLTTALSTSSSARSKNASTDFIRTSCSATLYPDVCFSSLARYASAVHHSPLRLARVANTVDLTSLRSVSSWASSLVRSPRATRMSAALGDCADLLGDARDHAKRSMAELAELAKLGETHKGAKLAWALANAKTWMSAELTNEDTCTDGFQGVGPSPVKTDVLRRVARAKQLSSNALSLVNNLVH